MTAQAPAALVDTSVWIEFLRGGDGASAAWIRERLGTPRILVSEPIMLELLAGARSGTMTKVERMLLSHTWCNIVPALDYRGAVDIYRAVREAGHTVRSLNDCVIATIALREGVPLAHRDADYARIADVTGLSQIDLR